MRRWVLVHDAARPRPAARPSSTGCSRRSPKATTEPCPGVPVTDTVKRVRDGVVVDTPDRDGLVAVQTPQAFVPCVLRAAAAGEGSDCASLVEASGGRIEVVAGDERLLR